eukprot:scaffold848_cov120-Amphora_coffeaeformis.AAC.3
MPYTMENIQAFKLYKSYAASGIRIPRKTSNPTKPLSFILPDKTYCRAFTHAHEIDLTTERVYLGFVETGPDESQPKFTLAYDDAVDQDYAKFYLYRPALWEHQQGVKEGILHRFRSTIIQSSNSLKNFKAAVKKAI